MWCLSVVNCRIIMDSCFSVSQRKRARLPHLLFKLMFLLAQHTVKHFNLGLLLFLLWGVNWWYTCRKPLYRPFKFWSTFEKQHNLLSVPTWSCYLSSSRAYTSLMVYLYSSFSPGVTLIVIQGQRWYSSHFTRVCVSHLSYFLDRFMELCFLSPPPCVCSLFFSHYM